MKELIKPTVKDVIELLQKLPPETPFKIEDADTGYTIYEKIKVEYASNGLWLWGNYEDMGSKLYESESGIKILGAIEGND